MLRIQDIAQSFLFDTGTGRTCKENSIKTFDGKTDSLANPSNCIEKGAFYAHNCAKHALGRS